MFLSGDAEHSRVELESRHIISWSHPQLGYGSWHGQSYVTHISICKAVQKQVCVGSTVCNETCLCLSAWRWNYLVLFRYESVIIPREEGKLVIDSPKKQKKKSTNPLYKMPLQVKIVCIGGIDVTTQPDPSFIAKNFCAGKITMFLGIFRWNPADLCALRSSTVKTGTPPCRKSWTRGLSRFGRYPIGGPPPPNRFWSTRAWRTPNTRRSWRSALLTTTTRWLPWKSRLKGQTGLPKKKHSPRYACIMYA